MFAVHVASEHVVHLHTGDTRAESSVVDAALSRIAAVFPEARLGALYLDTTHAVNYL